MKVLFKPFVLFVQWFGKILRIFWNGKKNMQDQPLEKEKRKNCITGATVLSLILSAVGIWLSVTPSDIERLGKQIDKSFEKMEQMDYLASLKDTNCTNPNITTYEAFRGETKMMMTIMRDQMEMARELQNNRIANDTLLINLSSNIIQSSQSLRDYSVSFFNRLNTFGCWRGINTNMVDSAYLASIIYSSNQFDLSCKKYEEEQREIITELKTINEKYQRSHKLAKRDMSKLSKLCHKLICGKTSIELNESLYYMLDVFYEYFAALQMNEMYGQSKKQ